MLSITSRANLADTVARPPPISMATSMASSISSKDAPALAACSMCHCMQDSQSLATEIPTAISSFCLFGNAPSAYAAFSIARKPAYTLDLSATNRACAALRLTEISSSFSIAFTPSRTGLLACPTAFPASAPYLHRLPCLPLAAREIRELLRRAAIGHASLAERDGSAPGRRVVDVNIRWQSQLHALRQAVRHRVIHAAMAADFLRHLAHLLPQRGLVFLFV